MFAEKGYSGAHVDEIAVRAGVNKATIYYQIGDKDTLYANVIHQIIGNNAQGIAQAVGRADQPEEKLKAYINFIAGAVDRNPELPPIMLREVASGGHTLPRVVMEDICFHFNYSGRSSGGWKAKGRIYGNGAVPYSHDDYWNDSTL